MFVKMLDFMEDTVFVPKQCHTNEGGAYYLGLWPLGLLSEVVSLCFGGNIPARRRLIYMESEFKLNSGTKCEHFVSTANRGQNQSVERHCLGENKQLEIKIYRIGSCSRG